MITQAAVGGCEDVRDSPSAARRTAGNDRTLEAEMRQTASTLPDGTKTGFFGHMVVIPESFRGLLGPLL